MFVFRRKNGNKNSDYRYYWRLLVTFFGCFLLGMLFSWLLDIAPALHFGLPQQYEAIFSREIPLLPWTSWSPEALYFALLQTMPAAILFLLGLRAGDFFCLSRIWNFVFFALHGMVFHRFLLLLLQAWRDLTLACRVLVVLLLIGLCLVLAWLYVIFLQINRTAAKGILIPCFGINRYFYPHTTNQPQSSRLLLQYLRSASYDIACVYVSEVALLHLCYGLRKCLDIFALHV